MISEECLKMVFNAMKLQIENSLVYVVDMSSDEKSFELMSSSDSHEQVARVCVAVGDYVDSLNSVISQQSISEDVLITVPFVFLFLISGHFYVYSCHVYERIDLWCL
jgi:hypothetical protein